MLEPLELPLVQGVVDLEAVGGPVGALAFQGEGLTRRKLCDALDGDPVEGSHLRHQALLSQEIHQCQLLHILEEMRERVCSWRCSQILLSLKWIQD